MNITRATAHGARRGSAEYFTGTVWLEELAAGPKTTPTKIIRVSFEPGARTSWHTHPHGQTLHILSGIALVQKSGEEIIDLHPGDTVWFEPGERHWHGAAPDRLMVHLAIQQADEQGNSATWLEHVTDADYTRKNA
jgi:quercetin dioxygenase-like cupin family protein